MIQGSKREKPRQIAVIAKSREQLVELYGEEFVNNLQEFIERESDERVMLVESLADMLGVDRRKALAAALSTVTALAFAQKPERYFRNGACFVLMNPHLNVGPMQLVMRALMGFGFQWTDEGTGR